MTRAVDRLPMVSITQAALVAGDPFEQAQWLDDLLRQARVHVITAEPEDLIDWLIASAFPRAKVAWGDAPAMARPDASTAEAANRVRMGPNAPKDAIVVLETAQPVATVVAMIARKQKERLVHAD